MLQRRVGMRIREVREQAGMTQAELAKRVTPREEVLSNQQNKPRCGFCIITKV